MFTMEGKKILLIEDEVKLARFVELELKYEGYDITVIHDGREGLEAFLNGDFDMILLDLMLPGMDGYKVCTEIRKISDIPVIMLTAKGETFDKVLGLELGADDYIVKPFDSKELVARVKAVLRRYEQKPAKKEEKNKKLVFSNLEINISNYTVQYNGEYVDFPPKEFELLHYLAEHPNQVFTREQLLDRIWGYEYIGDTRTVDVHIKRIREKLNKQEENWSIKTVWGVGYKFEVK